MLQRGRPKFYRLAASLTNDDALMYPATMRLVRLNGRRTESIICSSITVMHVGEAMLKDVVRLVILQEEEKTMSPNAQGLGLKANLVEFHCVHQLEWRNVRNFEISDCFGAFYFMQHTEHAESYRREVLKEFKTNGASSTKRLGESELTPRKYVTRKFDRTLALSVHFLNFQLWNTDSCTLAILMRSDVQPGDLPAEDGHSTITNDISSYQAIGTAAARTWDMCGKGLKSPGWATAGKWEILSHMMNQV
ncbi:MAG: hypothetical protein Q9186_001432 [Xanthomendoza sp. 1 TL-2023]